MLDLDILDLARLLIDRPTDALRVAGSNPTWNIYLNGLQVVVLGLAVFVYDFSMFVNAGSVNKQKSDTAINPRVKQRQKKTASEKVCKFVLRTRRNGPLLRY